MPSVSKKQHNFMAAVAKNPAFAKKVGVKPSVGEEFLKADKGKKFREGGIMKKKMRKFENGGEVDQRRNMLREMAERYAERPKSKLNELRSDIRSAGRDAMRAGRAAAEMTPAGMGLRSVERIARMAKNMPNSYEEEMGMKKGGKVHSDIAKDKPMMEKVAKKAVKGHEKRMHGMKGGGRVRKFADGGFSALTMNPRSGGGGAYGGLDTVNQGSQQVRGSLDTIGGALGNPGEGGSPGIGGSPIGRIRQEYKPFPGEPRALTHDQPQSSYKSVLPFKKGGSVSNASKRADGCAIKGKTRGKMV